MIDNAAVITTSTNCNDAVGIPSHECVTSLSKRLSFIGPALETIGSLSRTFAGVSDTSISPEKRSLMLAGEALRVQVSLNFRGALEWLLQPANDFPISAVVVAKQLEAVIERANRGLLRPGTAKFRTWQGFPSQVAPEEIPAAFDNFCVEYAARYTQSRAEAGSFAAWIEKEFNSRIHPLPDGCGRVSKILSVSALARAGLPYPKFQSRKEFFDAIVEPLPKWADHFRSRIEAAMPIPES